MQQNWCEKMLGDTAAAYDQLPSPDIYLSLRIIMQIKLANAY